MAGDGSTRAHLMGLDEWLLREDPDVSGGSGAAEELTSYDDDTAPEGDAQDAEYDAQADGIWRGPASTAH